MNDYRDITLSPVLQKLLENIMYERISERCKLINSPHHLQQGFHPQCGSITAAFTVTESVNYYFKRSSKVYAVFLGNQKAFTVYGSTVLCIKYSNWGLTEKFGD